MYVEGAKGATEGMWGGGRVEMIQVAAHQDEVKNSVVDRKRKGRTQRRDQCRKRRWMRRERQQQRWRKEENA
jgi:hypothetical protein